MHPLPVDARQIFRSVSCFANPIEARSVTEIVVTVVPFVVLWAAAWTFLANGHLSGLLLTIPAGGLLLRLFVIQHDCGHGSLFRRRAANDWVGRSLSLLTLTPYDSWRKSHAKHHATSGNLGKRGTGDVDTLTVTEYGALNPSQRVRYRLYRNPLVFFILGPAYTFLLRHRLPTTFSTGSGRTWASTLLTNAAIGAAAVAMIWLVGFWYFLAIHLPIVLIAATAGVWLFYVQHQFEHTVWHEDAEWDFHNAALHGSSHYDLPTTLRWFTGNIGIHHVHHLSSKIPFYRLPEVLVAHPELVTLGHLTLAQSAGTTRLKLWDPDGRSLVEFEKAA